MGRNLLYLVVLVPVLALAKKDYQTSALYSPSCDETALKKLAGKALIKISKQQNWANNTQGYIVTLDTSQLSFGDLTVKMAAKKCFNKNP